MISPLPPDNHITREVLTPAWQSWFASVYRSLVPLGVGTTTNRPTKGLSVGYGPFYDSTLAKPIWVKSTGPTVWQDAAGNVV
jgi:hypothetical protein